MTRRFPACVLAMTFVALIAVPQLAAAQGQTAVGIKAGLNVAKLNFEDDSSESIKTLSGLVAGLFITTPINDNVGFRIEGLYSQQGAKIEFGSDSGKAKVNYINVPVLLTAGPSSSGNTRFYVATGPQVGFRMTAKTEFDGTTEDIKDEVKSTDFSWVAGLGLESGNISVDARYALGLTDVSKDSDTVKNRVFSVTVGVKLK